MHLCFFGTTIYLNDGGKDRLMENLTTVLGLSALCCTNEDSVMKFPYAKKLLLSCEEEDYNCSTHPISLLNNLRHLHQLENVRFYGAPALIKSFRPMPDIPTLSCFPPNLKKLTFWHTKMEWRIMAILGKLPTSPSVEIKKECCLCLFILFYLLLFFSIYICCSSDPF